MILGWNKNQWWAYVTGVSIPFWKEQCTKSNFYLFVFCTIYYQVGMYFGEMAMRWLRKHYNDYIPFPNIPLEELWELILSYDIKMPIFFYCGFFFLLTTFFSFFFLNQLGQNGVFVLNLASIFLFWCSCVIFVRKIFKKQFFYKIVVSKWLYLGPNYRVDFSFLIDTISFSFMFLTISIALFVYIYTFAYFRYEPLVDRFLLLLNSFVLSMIFLVTSGNFIMMFLGWELIGLTSFFLINFWVTRVATLKAGFKAFVFNKFSDFFLFFAIILIYNLMYDLDIMTFNTNIHLYSNYFLNFFFFKINFIELISCFLLMCAFIKSAQIGPHIWLPDSMEAPVPASALIHSATLVSAGIFLVLRLSPLFEISSFAYFVLPIVGSLTAAYGGFAAMFTSDIKRILAYSTISHCGFLMVMCSTYVNEYTIIYLYVHGFFKASVFLCVGNIIRFSRNYQDFRYMGGYYRYLPFECYMSFICLFNLAGLPFGLGFYIKHILFLSLQANIYLYYIILFNCMLGAIAGIFYSYRLFYNVFFDTKKAKKSIYQHVNRDELLGEDKGPFYFGISLHVEEYRSAPVAASLAIALLILVSYLVCFYLLYDFLNLKMSFSDCNNNYFLTNYYNFFSNYSGALFNISFFNYLILFLILILIFYTGRNIFQPYFLYEQLSTFFVFCVFFFLFIIIL